MSALGQFKRFFAVSLLGLSIDVGISWLVHTLVGVALPLAVVVGFVVAAVFNYVQHARWTFAGSHRSFQNLTVYLALLTVIAGLRVVLVAWFETMHALAPYPLVILLAATAITFLVNFALSRSLVFRPPQVEMTEQDTK